MYPSALSLACRDRHSRPRATRRLGTNLYASTTPHHEEQVYQLLTHMAETVSLRIEHRKRSRASFKCLIVVRRLRTLGRWLHAEYLQRQDATSQTCSVRLAVRVQVKTMSRRIPVLSKKTAFTKKSQMHSSAVLQ